MAIQPPDKFPLTFYRDNCADRALTSDDVARAPVSDSRVVFVTGTGLSHEPGTGGDARRRRRRAARGRPGGRRHRLSADQWDNAADLLDEMRTLLASATLAVGTEEELAAATGDSDVDSGASATARAPAWTRS